MPALCGVSGLILTWNGGTVTMTRLPHRMLSIDVPLSSECFWLLHACCRAMDSWVQIRGFGMPVEPDVCLSETSEQLRFRM